MPFSDVHHNKAN